MGFDITESAVHAVRLTIYRKHILLNLISMVRRKNRYLVCKIEYGDGRRHQRPPLSEYDYYRQIKEAIVEAHGEYGLGVLISSLKVTYMSRPSTLLIRAARDHYRLLQSAIFFVKKVGSYEVTLTTIHIGGTIRTCQKFYLNYLRKEMPSLLQECKTNEERKQVQSAILSCANLGYSKSQSFRKNYGESEQASSHLTNNFLTAAVDSKKDYRLPYPFIGNQIPQTGDTLPRNESSGGEIEKSYVQSPQIPNGNPPHTSMLPHEYTSVNHQQENFQSSDHTFPVTDSLSRKRKLLEDRCDICNVKYASEAVKETHLSSKKHMKKMKMSHASLDESPYENKGNRDNFVSKDFNKFFCSVCKVKMTSQSQYDNHVASKKHNKKVKFQQRKDDKRKKAN